MDCSYFNRFFHRLFVSIEIKNVDAKHEKSKRKNIFFDNVTVCFLRKADEFGWPMASFLPYTQKSNGQKKKQTTTHTWM